ncbi:hypothetical protein JVT61DRAFT_6922 [Boletus reticuloceps]|uniref:Uncharacterized protein n=1 Tax=Boletus reticuloceps TaxID=495285 RepID=A0A8I2YIX1_9AGAM|nr:hypothetical protein JVT61DRAFT_6922 [Boletus reticuloceps]
MTKDLGFVNDDKVTPELKEGLDVFLLVRKILKLKDMLRCESEHQAIQEQLVKQVICSMGTMKLPAWLLAMLGHYSSIKGYEVASAEECVKYWKEHTEQYVQEWALSSSFDRLSLKAMPSSRWTYDQTKCA